MGYLHPGGAVSGTRGLCQKIGISPAPARLWHSRASPASPLRRRARGPSGSAPTQGVQAGAEQAALWPGARVTDAQVGELSLSPAPRFECPGEAKGVGSCTLPSAPGLCHTAATTPSISQGFLPSQGPAVPWGFLEGGDLPLQGWLRVGTLTLGAESCFLFFSPVSCGHSREDGFPSSRKTAAAGHCDPSRLQGGPGGCWAPAGPASTAPGGSGPASARLLALLGQRMQKARVCCRHQFPFMALLPPSLELGDW